MADAITYPTPGSVYVDDTGRTLHVVSVNPGDRAERHVVGYLALGERKQDYACSIQTFDVVWSERRVSAPGEQVSLVPGKPAVTKLYDGTRALKYTRRA